MSKGLGKAERAVLELVKEGRVRPGTLAKGGEDFSESDTVVGPVTQNWIVWRLSETYRGPAVRRAIISLVRKGLLYKATDKQGALVDVEPVTSQLFSAGFSTSHLLP